MVVAVVVVVLLVLVLVLVLRRAQEVRGPDNRPVAKLEVNEIKSFLTIIGCNSANSVRRLIVRASEISLLHTLTQTLAHKALGYTHRHTNRHTHARAVISARANEASQLSNGHLFRSQSLSLPSTRKENAQHVVRGLPIVQETTIRASNLISFLSPLLLIVFLNCCHLDIQPNQDGPSYRKNQRGILVCQR